MTRNPQQAHNDKPVDQPSPLVWLLVRTLPFIGTFVVILLSMWVWNADIGRH